MPDYLLPPGGWSHLTGDAPDGVPGFGGSGPGVQLTPSWKRRPGAGNTPSWGGEWTPSWPTGQSAATMPNWPDGTNATWSPSWTPSWTPSWPVVPSGIGSPHDAQAMAVGGAAGRPWAGTDPTWVYAGGPGALLAQGLRRTRSKIAPALDPRLPTVGPGNVAAGPAAGSALWRWAPAFRVQAVVAELLGRLVAQGTVLYWVAPPTALAPSTTGTRPVFTLPALGGFDWSDQIDKVLRAAVEREDRLPEILTQAQDLGAYFDAASGVDRLQAPRLAELLQAASDATSHVLMALKNAAAVWRPYQRHSAVQPVIPTPGHGSLPSGHATIAALLAGLYVQLLPQASPLLREQLDRLARRIAFNRVVAGVHFPIDSEVGYALGAQIAAELGAHASGGTAPPAYPPKGPPPKPDAGLREVAKPGGFQVTGLGASATQGATAAAPAAPAPGAHTRAPATAASPASPWAALWSAAQAELKLLHP